MGKKRKPLSQAEIWDDSALLQSWDSALTEYKLYHSIHARGERVEDVIQEAEAEEENAQMAEDGIRQAVAGMQNNGTLSEDLEDGELEDEPGSARAEIKGDLIEDAHESEQKERLTNANVTIDQQENLGMPNAIISGVKDETLKNLMMSWYYAGYYTGLYEGQQQSQDNLSK